MRVSDGAWVSLSTMPVPTGAAEESSAPVVLRIWPPEHPLVSAVVQVPPLPVTTRLPLAPVLLRTMPLAGPDAAVPLEMLWKVRALAPIVVLATFSAVPVVDEIVLPVPETTTVPPPVALKPAPDVLVIPSPPFENVIVGFEPVEETA